MEPGSTNPEALSVTPTEINSAYADAIYSRRVWAVREAALLRAEDELEQAETNAVNAGALTDLKNEMQREAKLREVCAIPHAKLLAARVDATEARGKFEASQLEVDRIQSHLRLMEIEKA